MAARYRAADGRQFSRSFKRKVDADKWLTIEEGKALRGEWVDPSSSPRSSNFSGRCPVAVSVCSNGNINVSERPLEGANLLLHFDGSL